MKNKNSKPHKIAVSFLCLYCAFFFLLTEPARAMHKQKLSEVSRPREAIVELEDSSELDEFLKQENLSSDADRLSPDKNLYLVKSLQSKSVEELVKSLEKNSRVKSAQPNYTYKPLVLLPRDDYYERQFYYLEAAPDHGGVSIAKAWDFERHSDRRIVIGIIDSGICLNHPDIKKNLAKGSAKSVNMINLKKKPTDEDGHGSAVAGLIGAVTNNKKGIAGASFLNKLKVMAIKEDNDTSTLVKSVNYAQSHHVMVANASWGIPGYFDSALHDAVANYSGLFIASAGNDNVDHDSGYPEDRMYPCDFDLPHVICVGAMDEFGHITDYSDYGLESVDVIAPGGTNEKPLTSIGKNKKSYAVNLIGTSFSSPIVAAEAGLLFSRYPQLSREQVKEIILNSVDKTDYNSYYIKTGGSVNFERAMLLGNIY